VTAEEDEDVDEGIEMDVDVGEWARRNYRSSVSYVTNPYVARARPAAAAREKRMSMPILRNSTGWRSRSQRQSCDEGVEVAS